MDGPYKTVSCRADGLRAALNEAWRDGYALVQAVSLGYADEGREHGVLRFLLIFLLRGD